MAFELGVVPFVVGAGGVGTTVPVEKVGFGTPQAYGVILSGVSSVGVQGANARMCIGFGDGANNEFSHGYFDFTNQNPTQTKRYRRDNIVAFRPSTPVTVGGFEFDSFAADGVNLRIESDFGTNVGCVGLLFKGAQNVFIGNEAFGAGVTPVNVGFKPDLLICVSTGAAEGTAGTPGSNFSIGAAIRGDGDAVSQSQIDQAANNGEPQADMFSGNRGDRMANVASQALPSAQSLALTSWDAAGFTVTVTGGGAVRIHWIAIQLAAGQQLDLGSYITPGATGADFVTPAYAGPTESLFFFGNDLTAEGDTTGPSAGSLVFGAIDRDLIQASVGSGSLSGATPSLTASIADTTAIHSLHSGDQVANVIGVGSLAKNPIELSVGIARSSRITRFLSIAEESTGAAEATAISTLAAFSQDAVALVKFVTLITAGVSDMAPFTQDAAAIVFDQPPGLSGNSTAATFTQDATAIVQPVKMNAESTLAPLTQDAVMRKRPLAANASSTVAPFTQDAFTGEQLTPIAGAVEAFQVR